MGFDVSHKFTPVSFTGKERVKDLMPLSKVETSTRLWLLDQSRGIYTSGLALVQPKDAGLV